MLALFAALRATCRARSSAKHVIWAVRSSMQIDLILTGRMPTAETSSHCAEHSDIIASNVTPRCCTEMKDAR